MMYGNRDRSKPMQQADNLTGRLTRLMTCAVLSRSQQIYLEMLYDLFEENSNSL